MKTGIELIAVERQRQITDEGWTDEHDDEHDDGSLALVAVCYATPIKLFEKQTPADTIGHIFTDPWPESWSKSWDKRAQFGECKANPGNAIPNPATYTRTERINLLIKAGALIAAEIDRLERPR